MIQVECWNLLLSHLFDTIILLLLSLGGLFLCLAPSLWENWAVAIISEEAGHGKHIVIWDCDPRPIGDKRMKEVLLNSQTVLVQKARDRWNIRSIWYNQDDTLSGQDRCLPAALEWINDVLLIFGDLPFQGREDPRLWGCKELVRN